MSHVTKFTAFLTQDPFAPELRGRGTCFLVCLHTFLNFEWERDSETWTLEMTVNASGKIQKFLFAQLSHSTYNTIYVPKQSKTYKILKVHFPVADAAEWRLASLHMFILPKRMQPEKQPLGEHPGFLQLHSCNCQAHVYNSVVLNQLVH